MKTNKKAKTTIFIMAAAIVVLIVSIIIIASCTRNQDDDLDGNPNDSSIKFPFWSDGTNNNSEDGFNDKNDENGFNNNEQTSSLTEIELSKLVKLDFAAPGYNGYGVPELSFDENYLAKVKTQKYYQYIDEQTSDIKTLLLDVEELDDLFEISLSEVYNNLSNGDKVYFEISLEEDLTDEGLTFEGFCEGIGIKFDKTKTYLTAQGLAELHEDFAELDVFRHIKDCLVFEGVNGHGKVSFDNSKVPSKDELIFQSGNYYVRSDKWRDAKDSIYFYVVYNNELAFDFCCSITSERENLSTGMTVSLKLEIIEDYDITDRWVFATTEYNIIVKESDLGEYLRDYELKSSETIEKVKSFLEAQDNLGFDGKDIVSFDSFYLATINQGVKKEHDNEYALVVILYIDNGWWDGYYCYALYDIFYMEDSIFADLDCLVTLEETASDAFAELDDDYTYELIMKLE